MSEARSEMQFREKAQNALEFLEDQGFMCVDATELEVRYESSKVYIEMIHGYHDCEVYINFGRLNTEERFYFTLFLRLVNPALEKSLGHRLADTPDTICGDCECTSQSPSI